MVLDGKLVAGIVKKVCAARIKSGTDQGARPPRLVILQGKGNAASDTYVKNKKKDCEELGIDYIHQLYDQKNGYIVDDIRDDIHAYNDDKGVDGIMLQLPVPTLDKYYESQLLKEIAPVKDVDGLRPDSICRITSPYNSDMFYPCTPHGIMMLLNYYGYDLDGMPTLVIGRSNLVGKPLALMLLNHNAELTVCHSHCTDDQIWQEMQQAKLIISAIGKPGRWDVASEVNLSEHPILIDVGTTLDPVSGKLVGDFGGYGFLKDRNALDQVDYTPVPGGVGPMTRAALMLHVTDAWEKNLLKEGKILWPLEESLPKPLKTEYERLRER